MLEHVSTSSDSLAQRPGVRFVGRVLSGVFAGTLLGALVLPFVLGMIPALGKWGDDRWRTALLGAAVGGALATLSATRKALERRRRIQLARQLFMRYTDDVGERLGERVKSLMGKSGFVSIHGALYGKQGKVETLLGDVIHVHGSGDSRRRIVRGIVCMEAPGLALPRFAMQPEGMMLSAVAGLVGVEDVDFAEHGEFSRNYHLSGDNPDAVRRLFQSPLLSHFANRPDWEIRGEGEFLVVISRRGRTSAAEMESLLGEAREMLELFRDAGSRAPKSLAGKSPDADAEPPVRDRRDAARVSWAESLIAAGRIRRDEITRFFESPPPRDVPPALLRMRSSGSCFATLFGGMLAVFGCAFSLFDILALREQDEPVPLVIGLGCLAVGSAVIAVGVWLRRKTARLLADGRCAYGTVEAVTATSVSVNNQQRYLARVRFEQGGLSHVSTVALYGPHVEQARRASDTGDKVCLLYDDADPKRLLLDLQCANDHRIRL